jgi:hypothetical protein
VSQVDAREDVLVCGCSNGVVMVFELPLVASTATDDDAPQSPPFRRRRQWQAHSDGAAVASVSSIAQPQLLDAFVISGSVSGDVVVYTMRGTLVGRLGASKRWNLHQPSTFLGAAVPAVRELSADDVAEEVTAVLCVDADSEELGIHTHAPSGRAPAKDRVRREACDIVAVGGRWRDCADVRMSMCVCARALVCGARRLLRLRSSCVVCLRVSMQVSVSSIDFLSGSQPRSSFHTALPQVGEVWCRRNDHVAELYTHVVTIVRVDVYVLAAPSTAAYRVWTLRVTVLWCGCCIIQRGCIARLWLVIDG